MTNRDELRIYWGYRSHQGLNTDPEPNDLSHPEMKSAPLRSSGVFSQTGCQLVFAKPF